MANISKTELIKEGDSRGFTLIEMLVYVALFGIVIGMVFNMIFFVYAMNKRIAGYTNVTADVHFAMERIVYETTNSDHIYVPTSNFINYNYNASESGQLSVATANYATANDDISFIDFYVDGGTLFMKMDASSPIPLTSRNIAVTDLNVDYFLNGARESVRINLIAESLSDPSIAINLSNTVTIR